MISSPPGRDSPCHADGTSTQSRHARAADAARAGTRPTCSMAVDAARRACRRRRPGRRSSVCGRASEGFGKRTSSSRLLSARQVVRVTAMRGTLHLMTAADYLALRGALQPALTRGMQSDAARSGAAALDFAALDAIARAFFGGKRGHLRRPADASEGEVPQRRRTRHGLCDPHAACRSCRCRPMTRWGFPAASDFALAEAWLGKKVPTEAAPAHVAGAAISRGVRTRDARPMPRSGRDCLRCARSSKRCGPTLVTFRDARKRELFDLPDAPRPVGGYTGAGALPPRIRQPGAVARRSHPRAGRRAPLPRQRSRTSRSGPRSWSTASSPGRGRSSGRKTPPSSSSNRFAGFAGKTVAELEAEGDRVLGFTDDDAEVREVRFARSA